MSTRIRFVTHADVRIDPNVPVPDWPLNDRGRARHEAHAAALADSGVPITALWSSPERKARDAAQILSRALSLPVSFNRDLAENDRSATGYLPKAAFEAMADRFFAEPEMSVQGSERAVDAQARVWSALTAIARTHTGDVIVVAHGGVGALAMARALSAPISRRFDQPVNGGGAEFMVTTDPPNLIRGWRDISERM